MKDMTYNSRIADKFVVRLPEGMRGEINDLARDRHISMNSYIVQKLETAIAQDKGVEVPAYTGLPNEGWVPRKGMLVQFKDVQGKSIPWEIIGFGFSGDTVLVELEDLIEGVPTTTALARVKPYVV